MAATVDSDRSGGGGGGGGLSSSPGSDGRPIGEEMYVIGEVQPWDGGQEIMAWRGVAAGKNNWRGTQVR